MKLKSYGFGELRVVETLINGNGVGVVHEKRPEQEVSEQKVAFFPEFCTG